jgi:polysaccharide biosynthesis/export protein
MRRRHRQAAACGILLWVVTAQSAWAQSAPGAADAAPAVAESDQPPLDYRLQPGDQLEISVWKEHDLQLEALVRPDGGLTFPLAGEVRAAGQTVDAVRRAIAQHLQRYIPDPVVTVAVKTIGGNHIYVIGKVARPGEFAFARPVDVMQALSLAGGTTPFAALNEIVILRRDNHGAQRAMRFRYSDIERGRDLEQNVVLESGDTVVVP